MLEGENRVVMVGGTEASKSLDDFSLRGEEKLDQVEIDDGTNVPSAADATGTKGTVVVNDSHIYVCVATDTWKRSALSTWS